MAASGSHLPTDTAKIRQLTSMIERKPSANAYINRGVAYFKQRNYETAIADYTQAIKLDPNNEVAYNNRGNALLLQRNYDAALVDYNEAIKLNRKYGYAYNNRGRAYQGKRKYEAAIADYTRAISLNPNVAVFYVNRGRAYQALGNHELAIDDYLRATELDNNCYANYDLTFINHTKELIVDEIDLILSSIKDGRDDKFSFVRLNCLLNRIKLLPMIEQQPLLQACLTAITEKDISTITDENSATKHIILDMSEEIINQLRNLAIAESETVETVDDASPVLAESETVLPTCQSSSATAESEVVEKICESFESTLELFIQPTPKRACILSFWNPNAQLKNELGDDLIPVSHLIRR